LCAAFIVSVAWKSIKEVFNFVKGVLIADLLAVEFPRLVLIDNQLRLIIIAV